MWMIEYEALTDTELEILRRHREDARGKSIAFVIKEE